MTCDFEIGSIVDNKYRINRLIGSGGMGDVYEATHEVIGRKVALKTLRKEYYNSEEVVARFEREVKTAGLIGHDNICEVFDVGTIKDGRPYLVMPFLLGCSLRQLIEKEKTLPTKRAVGIVCQVLSALEATHSRKIVHRDLKPDNIYLTTIGNQLDFVKLLDFGISKFLDRDVDTALTRPGAVPGTVHYMAPEQVQGNFAIDHRVDIYAVGVVLYEMVTGKRPFTGNSYEEVLINLVTKPFDLPDSLNPGVSPLLSKAILKAMARDPADRFASARAMRESLENVLISRARSDNKETSGDASTDLSGGSFSKPRSLDILVERKSKKKRIYLFAVAFGLVIVFGLVFAEKESTEKKTNEVIGDQQITINDADSRRERHPPQSTKIKTLKSESQEGEVSAKYENQFRKTVGISENLPEKNAVSTATKNRIRQSKKRLSKVKQKENRLKSSEIEGDNATIFISDYGD